MPQDCNQDSTATPKRKKRKIQDREGAIAIQAMKAKDVNMMWASWCRMREKGQDITESQCIMFVAGFLGVLPHSIRYRTPLSCCCPAGCAEPVRMATVASCCHL
jgi:hypothetical protein